MLDNDLISRAAARDVINTWGRLATEDVRMDLLHHDLNALPAVDAVPVVHGWWITNDDCGELECPICGGIQIEHGMFCTWCGARMDGGEDDEAD